MDVNFIRWNLCIIKTQYFYSVLWTNTVLRRVRESLSEMVHTVEMTSRIQARWWRLSRRSRQVPVGGSTAGGLDRYQVVVAQQKV